MWIIIDEKKVRHLWECPDCKDSYSHVEPWFYSEHGEPVCIHCDKTMEYIHTELDIEK
jgi:transposase-like protein